MYIDFSVTNQTLQRTSNDKTVENSQNYWKCRFNFVSADWGEVTKAALFKTPDMEKPVIRLLVNNECDFPNGTSRSACNIALIGGGSEVITALANGTTTVRSGMIVTTNTVCIPFEDTLNSDEVDCDLSVPDNDFTEFLSTLNAKITKIDSLQSQIKADVDGKVDKVEGKGLSANDYTDEEKEKLTDLPTKTELDGDLEGKQDKLTFDTAPTADSTNPVTSGGVKSALDNSIGELNNLYTNIKDNIVNAINEVSENISYKADKQTDNGGFGGGNGAISKKGGSAGEDAHSTNGGAVGSGAIAGDGFAGGENARTMNTDNKAIDAVQLGTGTNPNPYTAQIYDYPLIADDAEEPSATDGSKYLKDVGKLSLLQTTAKADIVSAINELKTQLNTLHGFGADFWTGFFKTGRTDFSYAFINNGAAEIKPTQVINATLIKYMLLNCTELLDASPVVVNLTADNPVVVGVCMGCLKLTKPPVINITSENAHVCRSYVSAFANCVKLTQCTIWLGDGTQSASGERTDMANAFLNCAALTSLTFTGSGSPKSLDLSSCKLLSNESIQSLHTALMDVSTLTSGTYKITINSEIQTKITALNLDFAAKGWTLEVKQEETTNV